MRQRRSGRAGTGLASRSVERSPRRIAVILFTLMLALIPVLSIMPVSLPRASAQSVPSGSVIVVLKGRDVPSSTMAQISALPVRLSFTNVFTGFAMDLTPAQALALSKADAVAGVYADLPVSLSATQSTGVMRIGAPSATQDPVQTVDTTVAVLDTGVTQHSNLNVNFGFDAYAAATSDQAPNCGSLTPTQSQIWESASLWGNPNNSQHGTHVAGIIGAEGQTGVVGVAPGANILAIKVFPTSGNATFSTIACGLDWMLSNQYRYNVGVVNMSIEGPATGGNCNSDALHIAVCSVFNANIPMVVAGGNSGAGSLGVYSEVLSVSAFNDFDGLPGGLGTKPATCGSQQTTDDQYATYNGSPNFAQIMAPGTCILSTVGSNDYEYMSGTSMAAPHVAGAIALYKASNPGASPSAAVSWLNTVSVSQSDPAGLVVPAGNGHNEKVLKLGSIPTANAYQIISAGRTSGSASPTLAYDNDLSTAWVTTQTSTPTSAYIYLSIGSKQPIGAIRWVFGSAYGSYADSFQIQLSTDRVNWTTVSTQTNADPLVWQNLIVNKNATYVRFLFANPNNDPKLGGIAEIKIFPADGATTDLPTPTPTATATATNTPTPTPTTPPSSTPYKITVGNRSSNSALPSLAYDNNMATSWVSTSTTPSSAWVIFGIGSVKPIGTIRYVFGSGLGGFADSWQIQVSADKIVWTTIATRGNASPGSWKDQTVNRNARWVRFIFSNPNLDLKLGGIAEVQILPATGPTSDVPTATPTGTAPSPTATPTQSGNTPPATGNIPFTTGSSRSSGSSAPTLAFDGDITTQWITTTSSTPSEAWLMLSLGGQVDVGDLWWVFATTGSAGSYIVQVTNDKVNYQTIQGFSNVPAGQWQKLTINTSARYIRFLFSNQAGTPKLGGIGEVRAYPPVGGASVASIQEPTPVATATPTIVASPVATETPVIVETPAATETPIATEAPVETPTAVVTEEVSTQAADSGTPAIVESPTEATATEPATETVVETVIPTEPTVAVSPTPGPGLPIASSARSEQSANATTAFDGNSDTDWRTNPGSYLDQGILQFDLGEPVHVSTVWWLVAKDAPGGRLVIDVSVDGQNWSVVNLPETFGEPGSWVSATLNVEARYVRFRFINDNQQPELGGVAEVVFLP